MIDTLLQELVTIFAVSAAAVMLLHLLKQPPIAGFIIAGIILGPSGLAWMEDLDTIRRLAEIGLIFLLFSIGIEFNVKTLSSMWRAFLGVGSMQVLITALMVSFVLFAWGLVLSQSLLIGFLVSLSSTAIALNLLHRRRELLSPQGSLSVAVLLFQDLFAVPFLLMLPLFAASVTGTEGLLQTLLLTLAKACALLIAVFLGSRYVVPFVLRFVTMTGMRELFLITIAMLVFGSAWAGSLVGLSVVFGAFLAGILVSETQYGHQVVADLVPLREPFVALFFVSVGMLLDLSHFVSHWPLVLALAGGIVVFKFLVSTGSAYFLRFELRIAVLAGLLLSQVGEFSFVIAEAARNIGALENFEYQTFLSVSIVTMLVSPSLFLLAPRAWPKIFKIPFRSTKTRRDDKRRHAIVIGLGVTGQNVINILSENQMPFVGIEMDARLFHKLEDKNVSVIFGDAARNEVLEAAGIKTARLVVIAINDPAWTSHIVATVRSFRPEIHVIVRLQYFRDMDKLTELHVNEIVVSEAQMAVELTERVLRNLGVEQEIIESTIDETERNNYRALREVQKNG